MEPGMPSPAKYAQRISEGSLGKPAAFGFSILWVVAIEVAKMQYFQFWSLSPPLTIELHIHEGATFLKPFKCTFQVHVLPRIWNHVRSSSTLALLALASCYIKFGLHFNRFDWPLHISSSYEPSCFLTHFQIWGWPLLFFSLSSLALNCSAIQAESCLML